MKRLFHLGFATLALALAAGAGASQIRVPIQSATSTLSIELCANPGGLGTACNSDTNPVTGFITVALDANANPTQIALRNFDVQAVGTYNLNLSWLFGLARVDATASNLRIYHARPGTTNAPVPVAGGAYTFTDVPILTTGTASYVINPTACGFVTVPCSSNINLSTLGENTVDNLSGTLQVVGDVLSLDLDFTFSTPLDPANPDLGTFTGHAIIHGSTRVSLSLVPRGSDWKYLDDGSDPGTGFVLPAPAFDDSAWTLGVAQLGYGDADEETVVRYGPDAANKYITTYFRHSFHVPDAAVYTNLALRVLFDDGVVVSLNGAEIYRANMPPQQGPGSLATVSVSGPAENVFFVGPPVDPVHLQTGQNLLAVELHQASAASSDISFDLELLGNGLFTNLAPTIAITSPTNNAVLGGNIVLLQADATDLDGLVTLVEFYEGANKLGEASGTGPAYSFSWTSPCLGTFLLTARATDNSGAVAVSAPVFITLTRPPIALVAPGSIWKFLDNGTNAGAAWRANSFNDASWASGPAQLGFGDGDEATVINGGPATNRYITTYFRRTFPMSNVADVATLTLHLLRDDGAAVYLNGTEIFRNNLPTGTPAFNTLSVSNATPFEESNFVFTASVSPALLLNGNNLVAVEVHQSATNSSDLSFDLALELTLTNRPPSAVAITAPANNSVFPSGADITFHATASDPDGPIRCVEYYAGANRLGQAATPPYTFVWVNAPAGLHSITAHAVDDYGAVNVSAAVLVRVGAFTMIPAGAAWRYLDNGTDQGIAWRNSAFNDASWRTGNAQFGYGDADEVTPLSRTNAAGGTNITFYFRNAFVVPDPSVVTGLVVHLLRDDGAIGYINAHEVFRSNMPTGAVNYLTPAPVAISGADETNFFPESFGGGVLQSGTNVIAVEIHQQSAGSSDVSFDLALIGLVGEVHPRLAIELLGNSHVVRWPSAAAGFRLQFSPSLVSPATWQDQPGTPVEDDTWKTLTLPNSGSARFYRLSE